MNVGLLIAVVALLAGNALFVGAEFAVISARRSAMEVRAERGSRAAKTVLWAMENVSLMLACAQLGITICSILLGVLVEPALAHSLEGVTRAVGLPEGSAHGVAVVIALVIIVGLHVVVGEMVPKNVAVSSPDRAALVFGPVLVVIARGTRPVIAALNWMANALIRLVGVTPRDEVTSAFTADEVHRIVERSSQEGTIDDAQGLLTGAIEFSDRTAADVMVPIRKVVSVDVKSSVAEIEGVMARTGFSRVPVVKSGPIVGYLHFKDLLHAHPEERGQAVPGWRVRQIQTVDADDEVESVLGLMRRSGAHVARVAKANRTVGLVFLEDIIEELVGEVGSAAGTPGPGQSS
jgi:CBS domain containing-hemolysin-like protein